jgi:hypothetical protein
MAPAVARPDGVASIWKASCQQARSSAEQSEAARANHPLRMRAAQAVGEKRRSRTSTKKVPMKAKEQSGTGFRVESGPLRIGAALWGAGALLCVVGIAVSSSTLLAAALRWINEQEQPPTELVKQKWAATKAATSAGASAWHREHEAHNGHHARVHAS